MKALKIQGGRKLKGTVRVSGAKNSSVALIPAAILSDDVVTICNVPEITDIDALSDILEYLGADVKRASESIVIDPKPSVNRPIPTSMAQKLRASYYFMGALLGKYRHVEMSFPGGCSIGARPINLHLKGFEALGAKITQTDNVYIVHADKLKGANIYLDIASVGATINIMLAAVRAEGVTTIDNAAKEPHIVDVANFLNSMGADIRGAGTDVIKINGVKELSKEGTYSVVPDQIETGTFMLAAVASKGDILIKNCIPEHLDCVTAKILEIGGIVEDLGDSIRVACNKRPNRATVKTLPYPGFPTDLQPQMGVVLSIAEGNSTINESIWDSRFQYTNELNKMGAKITAQGKSAFFEGVKELSGSPVYATDLRAGSALIMAGIIAKGETQVYNIEHIDRGYENIEQKFRNLGANIKRVTE